MTYLQTIEISLIIAFIFGTLSIIPCLILGWSILGVYLFWSVMLVVYGTLQYCENPGMRRK